MGTGQVVNQNMRYKLTFPQVSSILKIQGVRKAKNYYAKGMSKFSWKDKDTRETQYHQFSTGK